jgi:hypothetical protein
LPKTKVLGNIHFFIYDIFLAGKWQDPFFLSVYKFGLGKVNIHFLVMTFSQQENGPLKKTKKNRQPSMLV